MIPVPYPCELQSRLPPAMTFTLSSIGLSLLGKGTSKDNAAKSRNGTSEAFFLMLQELNLCAKS